MSDIQLNAIHPTVQGFNILCQYCNTSLLLLVYIKGEVSTSTKYYFMAKQVLSHNLQTQVYFSGRLFSTVGDTVQNVDFQAAHTKLTCNHDCF